MQSSYLFIAAEIMPQFVGLSVLKSDRQHDRVQKDLSIACKKIQSILSGVAISLLQYEQKPKP